MTSAKTVSKNDGLEVTVAYHSPDGSSVKITVRPPPGRTVDGPYFKASIEGAIDDMMVHFK